MPDTPLYGGARADLGATPQPLQPSNVAAQAVQQANQRGAAMVDGAFDRFAAIRDFGEAQKVEAALRQSQADFDTAMNRALSVAAGTNGSLYDENGVLDKRALDDLIYDYTSKINELKPQFYSPEAQMRSDAMRQQVSDNLRIRAMGHAATREIQMTKQACQSNYELAMANEDWDGVAQSIHGAVAVGAMSENDGKVLMVQAGQKQMMSRANGLLMEDPGKLWDEIDSGVYDDLPLSQQQSIIRATNAALGASRATRAVTGKDGKTKIVKEPPSHITKGLLDSWKKYNGDFASYDARNEVQKELSVMARGLITSPDDFMEAEQVVSLCKQFGQDEGFAKSLVDEIRKPLKDPTVFNPATTLRYVSEKGYLTPKSSARVAELARLKTGTTENNEELKAAELAQQLEAQKSSDVVLARFTQYFSMRPDATNRQKIDYLWGLVQEQYRGAFEDFSQKSDEDIQDNPYIDPMYKEQRQTVREGESMANDARARAKMKRGDVLDDVEKTEDLREAEGLKHAALARPVSMTVNRDKNASVNFGDDGSRAVIYVPEGSAGGLVGVTLPNRVYAEAEAIPTPGVTEAVMSKRLRRDLGLLQMKFGEVTLSPAGQSRGAAPSIQQQNHMEQSRGLEDYKQTFIDAGQKYGVDPDLLMAIAMHETGNGTSSAFRNKRNAMGVSDSRGPRTFGSVEESIDYMARQLRKNYLDKGLTDIASIGAKYAPVGAGNDPKGLNGYWADGVGRYYNQLKGTL
ncbi:glucosaminidase domain-containing protein [Akkermansia glycaniphila]|uniref:glucosaminidase domain-containing protein n=1 Tax=Akkermansia glycaniphila TaxID=1679444 RepID=UPI001C00D356|nr:glucosaminidase domain-containing protein [Akkermansia glycaniphila]MBT9450000.1 glucosaminidase domain-containing protein [Akkermansia glycaniphila]